MGWIDPEQTIEAAALRKPAEPPSPMHRDHARVRVELTALEARSMIRATMLVADVLRPELFRHCGSVAETPLVTAYQALVAACERSGVDLGLQALPVAALPR